MSRIESTNTVFRQAESRRINWADLNLRTEAPQLSGKKVRDKCRIARPGEYCYSDSKQDNVGCTSKSGLLMSKAFDRSIPDSTGSVEGDRQ